MINHCRTLLLNRAGSENPCPEGRWSEYVEPSFRPISYPGNLEAVRRAVLPVGCDQAYADFRMRLVTQALHSTEFAQRVALPDSRLTYVRPHPDQVLGEYVLAETVIAGGDLLAFGNVRDPRAIRLSPSWKVRLAGGTLSAEAQNGARAEVDSLFSGGVSGPLPLPGHPTLQVRVRADLEPNPAEWRLTAFIPPTTGMPELLTDLDRADAEAVADVLSGNGIYAVYRGLWNDHPLHNYRLTGLLLCWCEKAERFRRTGA